MISDHENGIPVGFFSSVIVDTINHCSEDAANLRFVSQKVFEAIKGRVRTDFSIVIIIRTLVLITTEML